MGLNLRPLPRAPIELPWVPNTNPPEYAWDARWPDIDVHDCAVCWMRAERVTSNTIAPS